jgi:hypothetical protein
MKKSKIVKKYLEKFESDTLREYEKAYKDNLRREFLTEKVFCNNEGAVRLINSLSNEEVEAIYVGLLTGAVKNDTIIAFHIYLKEKDEAGIKLK